MNPQLPTRIMLAGALVFAISLASKIFTFLSVLGHSPIFEWTCGTVSAVAFSTGMFLSFCGLAGATERRRTFFALHLIGLLIFCSMLCLYFVGFTVLARFQHSNAPSELLPALIEASRSAHSEITRERMARDAYRFYGVTLAYRRDNGDLVYYQPTAEDASLRDESAQDLAATAESRKFLDDDLLQYPWLFSFYVGSFFSVYLGGSLWLLGRKPGPRP
jgi:hypothetical protein